MRIAGYVSKKIFMLILLICISVTFSACGSGAEKVTITNRQTSEQEEISSKELYEISNTNSIKYSDCYYGSDIVVISEVEAIQGPTYHNWGEKNVHEVYEITLKGMWTIFVSEDHEILNTIDVGDTIKVSGILWKEFYDTDFRVTDGYLEDINEWSCCVTNIEKYEK